MRTIWIAVILLSVVLIGSIAMFIYTTIIYDDLQDHLNQLYQAVEEEEWEEAEQVAGKIEDLWSSADRAWTPVMDHRQVDRVDESVTRVVELAKLRHRDSLLLEITVTRRLLKRLKDTEIPDLQNVF